MQHDILEKIIQKISDLGYCSKIILEIIKEIMIVTKSVDPFLKFDICSRLRNCYFFNKHNNEVLFNILEIFEYIIKIGEDV